MKVGERIKRRRLELGMTQTDLALKMGYKTKSAICEVEKDGSNLTQNRLVKFAEALHCTPADLMGWTPVDYVAKTKSGDELLLDAFHKTTDVNREIVMKLLGIMDDEKRDF